MAKKRLIFEDTSSTKPTYSHRQFEDAMGIKRLCDLKPNEIKPGIKLTGANGVSGEIVSYLENKVAIRWANGKNAVIRLDPQNDTDLEMWSQLDKVIIELCA